MLAILGPRTAARLPAFPCFRVTAYFQPPEPEICPQRRKLLVVVVVEVVVVVVVVVVAGVVGVGVVGVVVGVE